MKNKPKPNYPTLVPSGRPGGELNRDEIAFAAYFIWEEEGRPQGRDVQNWRDAESQINQASNEGFSSGHLRDFNLPCSHPTRI